jgi:Sir2 family
MVIDLIGALRPFTSLFLMSFVYARIISCCTFTTATTTALQFHSVQIERRTLVSFHGYTNLSLQQQQQQHRRGERNRSLQQQPAVPTTSEDSSTVTLASNDALSPTTSTPVSSTLSHTTRTGATTTSGIEMHPPLLSTKLRYSQKSSIHEVLDRPPNPMTLFSSSEEIQYPAETLCRWFDHKSNVLCITGAGLSTESGIPDYRGYNGSYHIGHKPMIHDHFMKSTLARQRYWGRGMVGWRFVHEKQPSIGHDAITQLEKYRKIGVTFEDRSEYYNDEMDALSSSGQC